MHDHPHNNNFTLEFEQRDSPEGQSPAILFDPVEYMRHPDKWKPVVRLIDWDAAHILAPLQP